MSWFERRDRSGIPSVDLEGTTGRVILHGVMRLEALKNGFTVQFTRISRKSVDLLVFRSLQTLLWEILYIPHRGKSMLSFLLVISFELRDFLLRFSLLLVFFSPKYLLEAFVLTERYDLFCILGERFPVWTGFV